MPPTATVQNIVTMTAVFRCFMLHPLSCQTDRMHEQVDGLDADERRDDSSQAVDEQVPPQYPLRSNGPVAHSAKRERDQRHDDEGIEYDRGEHGAHPARASRSALPG